MKIQERYLLARNCSLLLVPKINPELWDDLSDRAQGRELGLQNLQWLFAKSSNPLLSLAIKVVQARSNKAETSHRGSLRPSGRRRSPFLGMTYMN